MYYRPLVCLIAATFLTLITASAALGFYLQPRIINGEDASLGEFPWQVAILEDQVQTCGGTLIAANWVLSAAHCFDDVNADISVAAGIVDLDSIPSDSVIKVKQVINHDKYNEETVDNDIALLELETSFDLSGSNLAAVPWITDATSHLYNVGSRSQVSGWGNTDSSGNDDNAEYPDHMQWVELKIVSCTDSTNYSASDITDNMICAGVSDYSKDACQGDSGGPLVVPDADGKWHLAGVVSWGDGCASDGYPGVYARVSQYDEWIKDKSNSTITPAAPAAGGGVTSTSNTASSGGSSRSGSLEHPVSWLLLLVLAAIGYRARAKASASREQV